MYCATWPLRGGRADAQQAKLPVIGFLSSTKLDSNRKNVDHFYRGLSELGYVEGRNVVIEYRVAEDHVDRLPALVADLINQRVAVIVTISNVTAALAAKAATQSIPIVFVMGADPIKNRLVTNLARPDANITGVTALAGELIAKSLSILRELVPAAVRVGYLVTYSYAKHFINETVVDARNLGVELVPVNASNQVEIDEAFASLARLRAGAVLVGPDSFFITQRNRLVALATHYNIPASYFRREFVEIGGLFSYSSDHAESYRQAGVYVGRILNGQKPADMPVLQPTKFELVINLKTAKALGLTIPPSLRASADELIE